MKLVKNKKYIYINLISTYPDVPDISINVPDVSSVISFKGKTKISKLIYK